MLGRRSVLVSVVSVCLAVAAACKRKESAPAAKAQEPAVAARAGSASALGAVVARNTMRRTTVETGYAVVAAKGADLAVLEKLARDKGGPKLEVVRRSIDDLFSVEQLAFVTRSLTPADAAGIEATPGVLLISSDGAAGLPHVRHLATVTRDVAAAAKGWVIDPETSQIHSAAVFGERVPGERPDVRALIVVHSVMGDNEMPFLDTAGLGRYGLHELYVGEVGPRHISQVTHLINGAAQTLLDGGDVNERGQLVIDFKQLGWDVDVIEKGTGKATMTLHWAAGPHGDADEPPVVELIAPGGRGPEHLAALITECFGGVASPVTPLAADDAELLAAGKRARSELTKLQPKLAKGIPPGEQLTVKARFTGADETVEWMWVEVVSFKATTLEGTLGNRPVHIPTLREGQRVKIKLADVADYLYAVDGKDPVGGYSIEIMRKRGLLPPME